MKIIGHIKSGERTDVDTVSLHGLKLRKKYNEEHKHVFESEVKNLKLLNKTTFNDFVDVEQNNQDERTLIFPYIVGGDTRDLLRKTKNISYVSEFVIPMMINEISALNGESDFIFCPEGLRQTNDPLTYIKLLAGITPYEDMKIPKDIRKLATSFLDNSRIIPVWGRYDPEFTNYIFDESNNNIKSIDYALMILHDSLYPFAYARVHLKQDFEIKDNLSEDYSDEFISLSKKAIKDSDLEFLHSKETEKYLSLNEVEVLAYLLFEYQEYAKRSDEDERLYGPKAEWAMDKLNDVLSNY